MNPCRARSPYSNSVPGNMWDEPEEAPQQDLELKLLRVGAQPIDDSGTLRVLLETTRGQIEGILHPVEGGSTAVICVGGAMGGVEGPADSLYARLPLLLSSAKVTVLRIEYRKPNDFEECVLDALAGCSFMKGIGAADLVLAVRRGARRQVARQHECDFGLDFRDGAGTDHRVGRLRADC